MTKFSIKLCIFELAMRRGIFGVFKRYQKIVKQILDEHGELTIDSYSKYLMDEEAKSKSNKK